MCSICGFPTVPGHWTDAGSADAHDRIRAQIRRGEILTRVLSPHGLKPTGITQARSIQLSSPSGRHAIVHSPSDLWATVEALLGGPFDPLDDLITHRAIDD
jgi:hypothetical protein